MRKYLVGVVALLVSMLAAQVSGAQTPSYGVTPDGAVVASGMTCNGTTDDTAAFWAAYNALPQDGTRVTTGGLAVRHGHLIIPSGRCVLQPITIGPEVFIEGVGGFSTTNWILANGSATGAGEIFALTIQPASDGYIASYQTQLKNIAFDCNGGYWGTGSNTASSGISWAGAQFASIEDVSIGNCAVRGLVLPANPSTHAGSFLRAKGTLWVLGVTKGPGIYAKGSTIIADFLSVEHINESGTYMDSEGDANAAIWFDGGNSSGNLIASMIATEYTYLPLKITEPQVAHIHSLSLNPAQSSMRYPVGVILEGNSDAANNTIIENWYTFLPQPYVYATAILDRINGKSYPSNGDYPKGSYQNNLNVASINGLPVYPRLNLAVQSNSYSSDTWYYIGTLGAASTAINPGAVITVTQGGWGASVQATQHINLSALGSASTGIAYYWNQLPTRVITESSVRAYHQSDGTTQIWLYMPSGQYGYANLRVESTAGNVTVGTNSETPQNTSPNGILVFATDDPNTFPVAH